MTFSTKKLTLHEPVFGGNECPHATLRREFSTKEVQVDLDGDLFVDLYEDNGGCTKLCDQASGHIPRAIVEELYRRFDAHLTARTTAEEPTP